MNTVILLFGVLFATTLLAATSFDINGTAYDSSTDPAECALDSVKLPPQKVSLCGFLTWQKDNVKARLLYRTVRSANPNAETIIFVNGGPGLTHRGLTNDSFLKLSDRYHLVWYDQRGAAASYMPIRYILNSDYIGMQMNVSDLIAIKRINSQKPVHIIGHSFGGLIAQFTAALFPDDVKSLILISSDFEANSISKGIEAGISTMQTFSAEISNNETMTLEEKQKLDEKVLSLLKNKKEHSGRLYSYTRFPGIDNWEEVDEVVPSNALLGSLNYELRTSLNRESYLSLNNHIERTFNDEVFLRGRIKVFRSTQVNGFLNHAMLCTLYPLIQKNVNTVTKLSQFKKYCEQLMTKYLIEDDLVSMGKMLIKKPIMIVTADEDELVHDSLLLKERYPEAYYVGMKNCDHQMLSEVERCIPLADINHFFSESK